MSSSSNAVIVVGLPAESLEGNPDLELLDDWFEEEGELVAIMQDTEERFHVLAKYNDLECMLFGVEEEEWYVLVAKRCLGLEPVSMDEIHADTDNLYRRFKEMFGVKAEVWMGPEAPN